MTKRETEAQRVFRKEFARMIIEFRQFVHAPYLLIGKATVALLDNGEVVTKDAIRGLLEGMTDTEDQDLVARTIKHLDHHTPPTS